MFIAYLNNLLLLVPTSDNYAILILFYYSISCSLTRVVDLLEYFVTALLEYINLLFNLFKLISWAVPTACFMHTEHSF